MSPTPMMLLYALSACAPPRPDPVPAEQAQVVRLQDLPFVELQIPAHSRITDAPIEDKIPLMGPWSRSMRRGRMAWATAIPIRPRGLFFFKPEPDMRLLDAKGKEIPYDRDNIDAPVEWLHDRETLWVIGEHRPEPGELTLQYPMARKREAALNLRWAVENWQDPEAQADFVWSTIQEDWNSRSGLLLPAPGVAAWELTVPPAGELSFVEGVVKPEIRDQSGSDGANLVVELEVGGTVHELSRSAVFPGQFVPRRLDLSRWAGQQVRLRIRSEARGTSLFDYVFLAEPALTSRVDNPVRVVMVFIDTLRPDHMSLYGYERDTTAAIDKLADTSAIFTSAYTVAPWTLPSARTIVTGRHPEWYEHATAKHATLQGILGKKGWANAFFAGNVYLSENFDMHKDWDLHRIEGVFPPAETTTDDALAWLEQHDGRNAIVQVHYMDAHLPYHEPRSYRYLYAGEAHERLGEEFHLTDVKRARVDDDPAGQQYIRDRYDNNIRYATDQVARLLEVLDDNDVLLLYADHGEEFWEHGKHEHGHSLFEELVHVPLVIQAPGIQAGKIDTPVSLIDLAPTVLELVGEPIPPEMEGESLVPLLKGDADARSRLAERDLAFGRPLYGLEQWGVLHEDKKWMVHEGREALFDLATDPGEKKNLLKDDDTDAGAPFRELLANALGREVLVGYRLTPTAARSANPPRKGLWAMCTVPGGFRQAWAGADPLVSSWATVQLVDDRAKMEEMLARYQINNHPVAEDAGGVEICWHPGRWGTREVFLIPERPMEEVGHQMFCSGFLGNAEGGKRATVFISPDRKPSLGRWRTPLNRIKWDERNLLWQFGIAPAPVDAPALVATDGEVSSMLGAIGYVIPDEPDVPEGMAVGTVPPCEPSAVPLPPLPPLELGSKTQGTRQGEPQGAQPSEQARAKPPPAQAP